MFQHFTKEANGSLLISSLLNQDVNSIPVLVNGTVDIVTLTTDTHKDLVHEPGVSAASSLAAQSIRIPGPKLVAPAADRLIGNYDTALRQYIFDITTTRTETVIEPDYVLNDNWRKAMTVAHCASRFHRLSMPNRPLM